MENAAQDEKANKSIAIGIAPVFYRAANFWGQIDNFGKHE